MQTRWLGSESRTSSVLIDACIGVLGREEAVVELTVEVRHVLTEQGDRRQALDVCSGHEGRVVKWELRHEGMAGFREWIQRGGVNLI